MWYLNKTRKGLYYFCLDCISANYTSNSALISSYTLVLISNKIEIQKGSDKNNLLMLPELYIWTKLLHKYYHQISQWHTKPPDDELNR